MTWTLALLAACTDGEDTEASWLVEAVDLGAPVATGTGYVFDTPQAAWTAAEHVVPDLRWTWPATNVPLFLWTELLMGDNVSDPGTCPYLTADGSAETWRTDCRSQDGYDWDGTYTLDETEQGSWTVFDYDFALDVASDVENRAFDRVALAGAMSYVDGDGAPLVRSSQSNLVMEVGGYWSRGFEDVLEQAWQHLAITGRWEGGRRGGPGWAGRVPGPGDRPQRRLPAGAQGRGHPVGRGHRHAGLPGQRRL